MAPQSNNKPPRQPLSPEELSYFIKLRKLRQLKVIEKFKKSRTYKVLNGFNLVAIVIYSELIFSFLGNCNFEGHYMKSFTPLSGNESLGGKRIYNSFMITSVNDVVYDVTLHDTCGTLPDPTKRLERFYVGKDWIFQKEIKVKYSDYSDSYILKPAASLLFISCLMGIVTFSAFGYNLNQVELSLVSISILNAISLLCFLLL